ncbi:hypothetical protein ACHAQA_004511 [Verticillium albo-atrum]
MEIETDEEVLRRLAEGGAMDYVQWPNLLQSILTRLDKDADKENNQPQSSASTSDPTAAVDTQDAPASAVLVPLPPGVLPPQLDGMLTEINNVLTKNFTKFPPHTIQRVSELIIEPRQHYRHLASYLHALDRVVHVTSTNDLYPLPPAIPDMSTMTLLSNGVTDPVTGAITTTTATSPKDPAANVSWGNPTNPTPPASGVGSDEALGGALLTPIPWLTRRPSPRGDSASSSPTSTHSGSGPSPGNGQQSQGQHEIRTESTETIDGPNGMGHIETVTVSVNGLSSGAAPATGPRPITQGELLRQEQQRGVVPVSQLARQAEEAAAQHIHAAAAQLAAAQAAAAAARAGSADDHDPEADDDDEDDSDIPAAETDRSATATTTDADPATDDADQDASVAAAASDADEVPHARGPAEIGADDLGPQSATRTTYGGPGVEMQGIDVEAAVGRKADEASDDAASDAGSEASQKREAGEEAGEGPAAKKRKDGDGDEVMSDDDAEDKTKEAVGSAEA